MLAVTLIQMAISIERELTDASDRVNIQLLYIRKQKYTVALKHLLGN